MSAPRTSRRECPLRASSASDDLSPGWRGGEGVDGTSGQMRILSSACVFHFHVVSLTSQNCLLDFCVWCGSVRCINVSQSVGIYIFVVDRVDVVRLLHVSQRDGSACQIQLL